MYSRDAAEIDNVWYGVDWISASLLRDEIDSQQWLYDAIHALEQVAQQGNTYKRRSLLGFDGWESGQCFVGSNETRHYAQFAGKYANEAYTYLEHPKVHVSRIDLQLTVQYSIDLFKEGRFQYARATHHNKGLPKHRQRRVDLWAGSSGGDTLYVGSPTSDTRARMYNKFVQSGDAQYYRSWRYEVVYRNNYASNVFRQLFGKDDEVKSIIFQEVVAYYRERGVTIHRLGDWKGNAIAAPRTAPTDVERKLRWIRNQVVPTIRKLAELGFAGEVGEMIAEALYLGTQEQR